MTKNLQAVIWEDDPDFLNNPVLNWRPSRPVQGAGMPSPRVWWAGNTVDRGAICLHWTSVDGQSGGSARVAPDFPLGGAAVASGDYVAVGSYINIYPHRANGAASIGFYDVTGEQPTEIYRQRHDVDPRSPDRYLLAAAAGSAGEFFVLNTAVIPPERYPTLLHRISMADGVALTEYPWPPPGWNLAAGSVAAIDVSQPTAGPEFLLYALTDGGLLRCTPTRDGSVTLTAEAAPANLAAAAQGPGHAWSVDETGAVWTFTPDPTNPTVQVWDWARDSSTSVTVSPNPGTCDVIRVTADAVLLRTSQTAAGQQNRVELFHRYLRPPGGSTVLTPANPTVVYGRCTTLEVSLATPDGPAPELGPAGAAGPTTVGVSARVVRYRGATATPVAAPALRAWGTRWGRAEAESWPVALDAAGTGTFTVGSAASPGLYRLTLTSDTLAPGVSADDSDYTVHTFVQVLPAAGETDLAPVLVSGTYPDRTPRPRSAYASGEPVTFLMPTATAGSDPAAVQLLDEAGAVLAQLTLSGPAPRSYAVPAWVTSALHPGTYRLRLVPRSPAPLARGARFTLGPHPRLTGYPFIEHVDEARELILADVASDPTPYEPVPFSVIAVPVAAARARRAARRGTTVVMGRVYAAGLAPRQGSEDLEPAVGSMITPPTPWSGPPAPWPPCPYPIHLVDWLGAHGVGVLAIATGNDSTVTLTVTLTGARPGLSTLNAPEVSVLQDVIDTLTAGTRALQDTASFRGWCWASNWWTHPPGANFAEADGRVPLLMRSFADTVAKVADRPLLTAAPGPARNPHAWPPVTFADAPGGLLQPVQAVDLYAAPEQTPWPFFPAFAVDFYTRPGKPALAHPTLWTDRGTGEQLLPGLLSSWGRGADAVGVVQASPPWLPASADPRLAHPGWAATTRSISDLLQDYGRWWTGLRPADRVAILARRTTHAEDGIWDKVLPPHFADVFHAHTACLYAGHPARVLFDEDLLAGRVHLDDVDVLLLVGEPTPLEPPLAGMLAQAGQRTGPRGPLHILCDGGCADLIKAEYQPLTRPDGRGQLTFNGFRGLSNDDYQHWTLRELVEQDSADLAATLTPLTRPNARLTVPGVDHPGAVVHPRRALSGRYLLVVDDTPIPLPPSQLWRTTVRCATRLPVTATFELPVAPGEVVYDVFAGAPATPTAAAPVGARGFSADLRHLPGRLFAVLPTAISAVRLAGPATVTAGARLTATVRVLDANDMVIAASIPVRVTLTDGDTLLRTETVDCAGAPAEITLRAPLHPRSAALTVHAVEMFTGRAARIAVTTATGAAPADLNTPEPPDRTDAPLVTASSGPGDGRWAGARPAQERFGPRARAIAVSTDGRLAAVATADWGENLYALDTTDGTQRWSVMAGQYTAFEVHAHAGLFAVTGFTFTGPRGRYDAEGYRLHLFDTAGTQADGISGYGLPRRNIHRFRPDMPMDPAAVFAVSADASLVVSSGNLGVALWERQGDLGWALRWNRPSTDRRVRAVAITGNRVLLAESGHLIALTVDNDESWRLALPEGLWGAGRILPARDNPKSAAVLIEQLPGLLLLDGSPDLATTGSPEVVGTIGHRVDHATLSDDGRTVAVTSGTELLVYDAEGTLRWSLPGDDRLGEPHFSPDNTRLAVHSHLGTLYVVSVADATVVVADDTACASAVSWLPDGDLLTAGWNGQVTRRTPGRPTATWTIRLQPRLDQQALIRSWELGDAYAARVPTATADPAPSSPPLLNDRNVILSVTKEDGEAEFAFDIRMRLDGENSQVLGPLHHYPPPALDPRGPQPLVSWAAINGIADNSTYQRFVELDFYRQEATLNGLTLSQDPRVPEGLVREVQLQYWDRNTDRWIPHHTPLLFDTAEQTHTFPAMPPPDRLMAGGRPAGTRKFRLTLPWGLVTNLYLTSIQVYGTTLGCSHPDARTARDPVRLYDSSWVGPGAANATLSGATPVSDPGSPTSLPGSSGYLEVDAAPDANGIRLAQPTQGIQVPPQSGLYTLADWQFPIVFDQPPPDQYRWLQFAWRSTTAGLDAFTLRVGGYPPIGRSGWDFYVGSRDLVLDRFGPSTFLDQVNIIDVTPPATGTPWTDSAQEWHIVRIDLLAHPMQPPVAGTRIDLDGMWILAHGARVAVDQILLAKDANRLPPPRNLSYVTV